MGSSVGASVGAEGQSGRPATGPDKDALLRQMACSVSLLDAAGNVLMATQDASPTLGYDTLVHINARHLIHPDDVAHYEDMRAAVLVAPDIEVDCQLRMLHAEGHYEVIECTARNLLHDERVGGILVTTRNVSRRHRHDRLLADANTALEAIAASRPLPEVAGLVRALLVHQDSDYERLPDQAEALFAALEGDDTPGGEQARWILTLAMSSHRATAELRQRATVDALTRLSNRVGFIEALREHLAGAEEPGRRAPVRPRPLQAGQRRLRPLGRRRRARRGGRRPTPGDPRRRRRRPLRRGRVRGAVLRAGGRRRRAGRPSGRSAPRRRPGLDAGPARHRPAGRRQHRGLGALGAAD